MGANNKTLTLILFKIMIEKIESKALKLVELVKEYKRSEESLTKKYHVVKDTEPNNYFLIYLNTKEIICAGRKTRLKSYMNLRNIKPIDILDFNTVLT